MKRRMKGKEGPRQEPPTETKETSCESEENQLKMAKLSKTFTSILLKSTLIKSVLKNKRPQLRIRLSRKARIEFLTLGKDEKCNSACAPLGGSIYTNGGRGA